MAGLLANPIFLLMITKALRAGLDAMGARNIETIKDADVYLNKAAEKWEKAFASWKETDDTD